MNNLPNKAIASSGGIGLGGAIVVIVIWAFQLNPPPEVVVALNTLVSGILGFFAVFFTPSAKGSGSGGSGGSGD